MNFSRLEFKKCNETPTDKVLSNGSKVEVNESGVLNIQLKLR